MADMLRFLKGSQSGLDTLISNGQIKIGAFYLTNDTNRLYIGKATDNAELLNNGVQVVANVASLPSAPPAIDGDFYYCKAENIFATYDKDKANTDGTTGGWVQINVDSYITSVTDTVTAASNIATVTTEVGDSNSHKKSDAFQIKAGTNMSLSASGKQITLNAVDEKTTEAGHYAPGTESGTFSATSGHYVTGVKYDSKKHVMGITSTALPGTTHSLTVTDGSGDNAGKVIVTSTVNNKSDTIDFVGGGATTVARVDEDSIQISSTDQSVTEVGNHYKPEADASKKLSLSSKILTEVSRDAAGHVTGIAGADSQEDLTSSVTKTTNPTMTYSSKNVFGTVKSDTVTFTGSGATTVTGNGAKGITISSTDKSVTAVGNHYTPTEDTSKELSLSNQIVTTVKRDAAGHVTGIAGAASQEDVNITTTYDNSSKTVTVTSNAKNIFGTNKSDAFSIKGSGATTATVDTTSKQITITSTDQSVTAVGNHYTPLTTNNSTISANGGSSTTAKATTQVVTGVKIDAAGHVTGVTSAGVKDTHNDVSGVDFAVNTTNSTMGISVTTTDGTTKSDAEIVKVKYGSNDTKATLTSWTEGSDTVYGFDLNVYTTTETDNKIAAAVGANGAVQIMGTISAESGLTGKTNIKQGDTYILSSTSTVTIFGKSATSGDMFIAKADKASGSTASDWYYVPAGNDVVKSASTTTGFQLKEGASNAILGEMEFTKSSTTATDFQITPTISNASVSGSNSSYNKTTVSYNLYWGEF